MALTTEPHRARPNTSETCCELLDPLRVRLPAEVVRERLRAVQPATLRSGARRLVIYWLVLGAIFVPAVWALSGRTLGIAVLGAIVVLAGLSAPLSRRHLEALRTEVNALPWDEGVSFVSPSHGAVLLLPRALAFEDAPVRKPMGVVSVTYDSAEHALVIKSERATSMRSRGVAAEHVSLPPEVSVEKAEAIALLFHFFWTGELGELSEATRTLLGDRLTPLTKP